MTNITLRPGDYVRTEGMTEEQYRAVLDALNSSGCSTRGFPSFQKALCKNIAYIRWNPEVGCAMYGSFAIDLPDGRELTIDQILGTEGAQQEEPMTIEQLLTKANKHAAKAAKHERKVAEHEAKRREFFSQAAELIPHGYVLREMPNGDTGLVKESRFAAEQMQMEDLTDPANWKAGDVVECVEEDAFFSLGSQYTLLEWAIGGVVTSHGSIKSVGDEGEVRASQASCFRWISRPASEGGE